MDILPNELILEIISYLPNHALQEFMKTSKKNCELCGLVWKRKYMILVDGNRQIGFYKDLIGKPKLVYYFLKYTHGLHKHMMQILKPMINKMYQPSMYGISYEKKITMFYECFDLYVKFKDFILNHNATSKLKVIIQEKLHQFLFEKKNDYGSNQARQISHKYYPILFSEIYYLTLLINTKCNNRKIRSRYGIE